MKEDLYPRLEVLCRLCLAENTNANNSVQIFQSDAAMATAISIPMRIMACAALEVQRCDGLPKTICTDCRYQLEKSYYFRKRSQATDSKLRKHIRLLSLGKKSRVFAKANPDEEDDDDELEFADSLSFLKEHDDIRIAEELRKQEEMNSVLLKLSEFEQQIRQRREDVRAEVREELRSSVAAAVKEELRAEVRESVKCELRAEVRRECIELAKQELREEVREDCHQQERTQLLEELEKFLHAKKCNNENTQKQTSDQKVKEKTLKLSPRASTAPSLLRVSNRQAASSLLLTKQKFKVARTMLPTSVECSASALPTAEMEALQAESVTYQVATVPPTSNTADADGKSASDQQDVDEVMVTDNEPNFYILESDDGNELEPTHVEEEYKMEEQAEEEPIASVAEQSQKQEQLSVEADSALFISEDETANFRLAASDNSKKKTTTSYQIGNNGEIQFFKQENKTIQQSEEDDDEDEDNGEDNEDDVMVFNYNHDNIEEGMEHVDLIEFVNIDKTEIGKSLDDENALDMEVDTAESAVHIKKLATKCAATSSITSSAASSSTAAASSNASVENSLLIASYAASTSATTADASAATIEKRSTDTPKTFHCNACPQVFSMKSSLLRHQRTHIKSEQKGVAHMCPHCSIYLSCRSALRRHMLIHSGTREFTCEKCDKSFVQREVLKRHMQTHTGERPYKCEYCDRTYTQKVNLQQHINLNHLEVPKVQLHTCHLCPKRFNHASGLSRHLATHSGVAYQCTECERTFGDRSSVKRHIANIHGIGSIDKSSQEYNGETAAAKNAAIS